MVKYEEAILNLTTYILTDLERPSPHHPGPVSHRWYGRRYRATVTPATQPNRAAYQTANRCDILKAGCRA